jgi:predicted SAM-dependent methyltransferase
MVKIDLSPTRITADALVVWHEPGDQVDLVMDPRKLTFRPDSVDQIITNHVIDQLFLEEAKQAMVNWRDCLKKSGHLFILTDDFEYIARAFVGGDIDIGIFNRNHSHASQWDRQLLGEVLIGLGFPETDVKIWFEGIKDVINKQHYELLIQATK